RCSWRVKYQLGQGRARARTRRRAGRRERGISGDKFVAALLITAPWGRNWLARCRLICFALGAIPRSGETPMIEPPSGASFHAHRAHDQTPPPAHQSLPRQEPPPNPEQAHAVDAIFAGEQQESSLAGLLAAWGGTMLLADLAQEHLQKAQEEPPPKLAKEEEPDE